jgi:hypothetical protein
MGCLFAAALARSGLRTAMLTRPSPSFPPASSSEGKPRPARGLIRVVETYRGGGGGGGGGDGAAPVWEARVGLEENCGPQQQAAGGRLPPIARLLVRGGDVGGGGTRWMTLERTPPLVLARHVCAEL